MTSTLRITKSRALAEVVKKLIAEMSKEDLETILNEMVKERRYKVEIVSDETENDNAIL